MRLRKVFEGLFVVFFIWVHFWLRMILVAHKSTSFVCNEQGPFGIALPIIILLGLGCGIGIWLIFQWWQEAYFVYEWSWTFMIAGGLANLLERAHFGCIMDYITVPYFPVFNIADILLTMGVLGIVIKSVKRKNKKDDV